ncbi:MAG: RidA family protein [Hyphomicrobiales bacterium]|nr:RidA family protein [Hyphomicrobiales bacterium]
MTELPANRIDRRLAELGIALPAAAAPVANYVPAVVSAGLLIVSGQLPFGAGGGIDAHHKGKLGGEVNPPEGSEAARRCALNVLAQARAALGSLDRIVRVVRLGGFINCRPHFDEIAPVMNGASDLMVEIFGEAGRHARSTVGVAQLPLDACVEVEAMFEVTA